MKKNLLISIGLIALISSCSKYQLSPAEYIKYVSDRNNSLTDKVSYNNLNLELTYLPCDFQISNELGKNVVSNTEYTDLKKQYEGHVYFKLKISDNKNSTLQSVQQSPIINSLLKQDGATNICLQIGKKQLPVSLYHIEQGMNLVPYVTVLFSFGINETEVNNDLEIIIKPGKEDKSQPIKFSIHQEAIASLPALRTE